MPQHKDGLAWSACKLVDVFCNIHTGRIWTRTCIVSAFINFLFGEKIIFAILHLQGFFRFSNALWGNPHRIPMGYRCTISGQQDINHRDLGLSCYRTNGGFDLGRLSRIVRDRQPDILRQSQTLCWVSRRRRNGSTFPYHYQEPF